MAQPDAVPAASLDAILARLRLDGGRVTPARRAVVTTLLAAPGHVSADEVAARVQAELPDVSQSTVYRTLDVLERLGEIEHVHVGHGHGPARYHLAGRSHAHLLCRRCDQVFEIELSELDGLAEHLADRHDFQLEPGHFALLGTCASCRKPAKAGSRP